ncbi:hypothetical protein MTR67_040336 [Solanum verrucosum]|uniref:Uncharacterized protein n=1 Tax=Solanum verrucosum TaxID=315347 RepID=A0AAF0ZPP6_SOLVR|nr:hypothetical protein MTR67_040336 [Solanum verrucosum]
MSAKEEVREGRAHVVYNGSASRINEIGLHIYLVSEYDSGEGIPYAPVDWPNAGDKWGWRAGKRVTSSGTFRDRYLYLPKNFKAPKGGKKNAFRIAMLKSSNYDGYNYILCEATVDGYICGHVSHLDYALRAYMAGTVGGSINLDVQYLCRYYDSRMDSVPLEAFNHLHIYYFSC